LPAITGRYLGSQAIMNDTARGHNGPTEFLPKPLTVWREA
jgi:hypothetical protein